MPATDLSPDPALRHAGPAWAFGLPQDRLARVAARRAFVEMKHCFMRAAADIDGSAGALLQGKVRLADEVIELWRLRHALLSALPHGQERAEMHRRELRQQLDSAFPESGDPLALP